MTTPPFVEAPLFAEKSLPIQVNAVAAEIYEKMIPPGFRCVVDDAIGKTDSRATFKWHGDAMTFVHATQDVDEAELAVLPYMLKGLRMERR